MHRHRDATTHRLLNTPRVEAIPAPLLRARDNPSARQLAGARWVLRRKRDGRYLATIARHGGRDWLAPLHGSLALHHQGVDSALAALGLVRERSAAHARRAVLLRRAPRRGTPQPALLPADGLRERLAELGIDGERYATDHALVPVPEPAVLACAGRDRYRRPLFLVEPAARAWRALVGSASGDGVALVAISGYRSHDYQLGIFRRKRARGQSVAQILRVNTAPGYSEHHSGRALDIGAPDQPPAEESFEGTEAFAWLTRHAGRFGFVLSYPRDNPHGIVYEPWHWCWHAPA